MKHLIIGCMPIIYLLVFTSCEEALLGPDTKPALPQEHTSRFETTLDSLRYYYDMPALGGAIITTDTILYAGAVGCRRYGGPANVSSDDRFHLGSCTKALTAAMIATLVEDGKLTWESTLSDVFPEYSSIPNSASYTYAIPYSARRSGTSARAF